MHFHQTKVPPVMILEPEIFGDERGFFLESYRANIFAEAGIDFDFVQDNHSGSRQGTLRGMHYQIHQTQGKLVRVVKGEVFDVAVDLRRSSPTFGQWVGQVLSSQNKLQIWVPPDFAHGFYVLSEWAELVYKATDYYAPEWERTLFWNDKEVGIQWPLLPQIPPLVSAKDSQGQQLKEIPIEDLFA